MSSNTHPIFVTSTPADVVRRWIGEATREGLQDYLVERMAESVGGTAGDVYAVARGSAPHLDQLLDPDLVQRLATSIGESPLSLAYRTVLRFDLSAMEDDEDEERGTMEDDEKRPSYRFVMSDAEPDRADDIVEQTWNLSEFRQNPVAPYNHDYSAPPIGRWVDVEASGGVLRGTLIPTPVDSYPLSQTVAALLSEGVLRTVSVGFRPGAVISRASLAADDDRRADRGAVYVSPRLLEASVTPMPMNPRAALARMIEAQPVSRSVSVAPRASGLPYAPAPSPEPTPGDGFPWS